MDVDANGRSRQILTSQYYTTWSLVKLYWQSEQKLRAYLFSAAVILLTSILIAFEVVFNYWYNYFYDALQAYSVTAATRLLFFFFILAGINIVIAVYRYYVTQLLALNWRRWLTKQVITRWMDKRGYYYLESFDNQTDNPDQRIQEDINGLATSSINLVVGLFSAIVTFCAFVYILWSLSGVLTVDLGSFGVWRIHGYLVWVGLFYNLIGTLLTFKIGRPLVGLNFQQQQREATFRFSAIDLRSHAEQVAMYRGEEHQKKILRFHFKEVLENWYAIILRQKKLLWFTAGFNQAAVVLPLIVALPNYFGKVFMLGGLMQSIRAFGNVQESLSYLVNAYTQIAEWRAICQRLTTFLNHLTDAENHVKQERAVQVTSQAENAIAVKNLVVKSSKQEILLDGVQENFLHGHNYVIKGESGIGKSTFLRTLAGVWPYAKGEIVFPANKRMMYLPQNPYMPMGTLAEAILFPDKNDPGLAKNLEKALHDCHLDAFIPRLNEVARWSEQLSPGEQQRIAFARVLLHKPDWVFLDESTSMLDPANERHLYLMLHERLPTCTVVSVGHHASVDTYHEHTVDMTKYSTTAQEHAREMNQGDVLL